MAILIAMLSPLLSACGFEPLYAEHDRLGFEPKLAAIKIAPIKEHIGQLLAWHLENVFNPDGVEVTPRYGLHVTLSLRQDFLATQPDAVSTRGSVSAAADCVLTTLDGKTVLYRTKIQSVADYNIVTDAYSSQIGENNAQKRAIDDIGDEIETRLTLYFRAQTAER